VSFVTKCPKIRLFLRDGSDIFILLILQDKQRFCVSGMKIALAFMAIVIENS